MREESIPKRKVTRSNRVGGAENPQESRGTQEHLGARNGSDEPEETWVALQKRFTPGDGVFLGTASKRCPQPLIVEGNGRVCNVVVVGGKWTHEDAETAALWCMENLVSWDYDAWLHLLPGWVGHWDGDESSVIDFGDLFWRSMEAA